MDKEDLEYYMRQMERLDKSGEYPITVKFYSNVGETKHMSINRESLEAIVRFFESNKGMVYKG